MRLDPKRTLDELIASLAPDERTRDEVALQPHLPGAVRRGRRLAGVQRRRQALRARPRGRLRRDRARHAAVAQRARLPRRSRPPDALLRGPRAAVLLAPSRPRRARRRPRHRARCSRSSPASPASTWCADLSVFFRSLGGMIDGLPRARARRRGAAARPGHDVPARHLARARAGRGGDRLRRRAGARRRCRSAALIVNRVHRDGLRGHAAEEARAAGPSLGDRLARRVATSLADFDVLASATARASPRLERELGERDPVVVPRPRRRGPRHRQPGRGRAAPVRLGPGARSPPQKRSVLLLLGVIQ